MTPRLLIGLTGRRGAGKDTAAAGLERAGFVNVKMAGALKRMLDALLLYQGYTASTREQMIEGRFKEEPTAALGCQTPRHAMQTLGSEWGRGCMGPNFWVDIAVQRIRQFDRVVVTDIRFPNEAAMIRGLGGKLYRIERPGPRPVDAHDSEQLIDGLHVDGVIVNDHATPGAFAAWFAKHYASAA